MEATIGIAVREKAGSSKYRKFFIEKGGELDDSFKLLSKDKDRLRKDVRAWAKRRKDAKKCANLLDARKKRLDVDTGGVRKEIAALLDAVVHVLDAPPPEGDPLGNFGTWIDEYRLTEDFKRHESQLQGLCLVMADSKLFIRFYAVIKVGHDYTARHIATEKEIEQLNARMAVLVKERKFLRERNVAIKEREERLIDSLRLTGRIKEEE